MGTQILSFVRTVNPIQFLFLTCFLTTSLKADDGDTIIQLTEDFNSTQCIDLGQAVNSPAKNFQVSASSESVVTITTPTAPSLVQTVCVSSIANAHGQQTLNVVAIEDDSSESHQLTIIVVPQNDSPSAIPDQIKIFEQEVAVIDVLANDVDPEDGQLLSVELPSARSSKGASIELLGQSVRYRSDELFNGLQEGGQAEDSFAYIVTDSQGAASVGEVTVVINGVNSPPQTQGEQYTVSEGGVLNVTVDQGLLANDQDIDHLDYQEVAFNTEFLQISAYLIEVPKHGDVRLNLDGSFTYSPAPDYFNDPGARTDVVIEDSSPDTFSYRVIDKDGANSVDTLVEITVVAQPLDSEQNNLTIDAPLALSQQPLELGSGAKPNVLVIGDDSSSMDFDMIINGQGVFREPTSTNASVGYAYVLPQGDLFSFDALFERFKRFGVTAGALSRYSYLHITPSHEAILSINQPLAKELGVWRARSASYNKIYYNPKVHYKPWAGVDFQGNPYLDVDPFNAPIDPINLDPRARVDLTQPIDFVSALPTRESVDELLEVTNYYIPRYYDWVDTNGNGVVDSADSHTKIEITPDQTYPGSIERGDCRLLSEAPFRCSYAEELRNFANWFSYYRRRSFALKASLGEVVAQADGLSVGYTTINRRGVSREVDDLNTAFNQGHKRDLLNSIYSTPTSGSTPLRQALDSAGRYYACESGDSFGLFARKGRNLDRCPVDKNSNTVSTSASTANAAPGSCQQNYTVLFTDGARTGSFIDGDRRIANADGDTSSNFDGGVYADAHSNTLADIAMYYYETDLHPDVSDQVPMTRRDVNGQLSFSNVTVMHQHMTTYTVGLGVEGSVVSLPSQFNQSFSWLNPDISEAAKIDELKHTALNARGDFKQGNDPKALAQAFSKIFSEVKADSGSAGGASANSREFVSQTLVFKSSFDTKQSTGDLIAVQLTQNPGNTLSFNETLVWSAAKNLDEMTPDDRKIITSDDQLGGIPFRFDQLSPLQKVILDEHEVNYLRGGDLTGPNQSQQRIRPAINGRLGDIVNSTPVFVGAPPHDNRDQAPYPDDKDKTYSEFKKRFANRPQVVYVGANDGMLHGFYAEDNPRLGIQGGDELFAYIPNRLINGRFDSNLGGSANRLDQLVYNDYVHKFFVDGTPVINDVFIDRTPNPSSINRNWRSVLVGSLRSGGRGYFALDITQPNKFNNEVHAAKNVLWEFTDADDRDLGFSYSDPILTMSNVKDNGDQVWVAIFGNGFNSDQGRSVLYVLFIERGIDGQWTPGDFVKLDTGHGPYQRLISERAELVTEPNGLGAPRAVDIDGNGTVDYVYAGDLKGNLYRFDVSVEDHSQWRSVKLFQAKHDSALPLVRQPMINKPIVVRHPTQAQGIIVVAGSGRYLSGGADGDTTSSDLQSIYGIWDRFERTPNISRANLVEQELENLASRDNQGRKVRMLSDKPIDWLLHRGWYIDLDIPALGLVGQPEFPGERAVRNLQLRGGFVFVNTVLPQKAQSCSQGEGGFQLAFNPATGGSNTNLAPKVIFDTNSDGFFDEKDMVEGQIVVAIKSEFGVPLDATFIGNQRISLDNNGSLLISNTNTDPDLFLGRFSWSEMSEISFAF